jgi:hypothetical protein
MRTSWNGTTTTITATIVKFLLVNAIIAIAVWSVLRVFYGV